jgi:hypothetical protein
MKALLLALALVAIGQSTFAQTTWQEEAKARDYRRAAYWKQQGYHFDPEVTSAILMDGKVRDYQRAAYWKTKGYRFDPETTPAILMDAKVRDYERAAYWKQQGHIFDPEVTPAILMDAKVRDRERAAYWKTKGYSFDPETTPAILMDAKASEKRQVLRALPADTAPRAILVDGDETEAAFTSHLTTPDNRPASTAPPTYRPSTGSTYSNPATASYTPPAAPAYAAPKATSSSNVAPPTYTRQSSPSYTRRATPTYSGSSSYSRYTDYNYRPAVGDHYVQGHFRSDGTYVDGHHRTDHDDSFWNNYSSLGNVNPYTGSTGTMVPSYRYSGGGSTYVRGYFRSNGAYVSGHTRRSR